MKKLLFPVVALIFALSLIQSCSKGGGGGGCTEPAMTVTSDPAAGSNLPPAVGPTFALRVNITANKPSAGVTIEIKAHPEGSSTNFYTTSVPSTTNINDFTITNT